MEWNTPLKLIGREAVVSAEAQNEDAAVDADSEA
jgi:hypothetical protein